MQNIDSATLQTILTIRLSEYHGAYHPAAVAEYVITVIAEAGLLAVEARDAILPSTDGHAPLEVAVVAEALRANLGNSSLSLTGLATVIIATLQQYGISRIGPVGGVRLSQRQRQSLTLYAQGNSYEEIGTIMGISSDTVKNHLERAREAFGARNTVHAVVKASTMRLIDPDGTRILTAA